MCVDPPPAGEDKSVTCRVSEWQLFENKAVWLLAGEGTAYFAPPNTDAIAAGNLATSAAHWYVGLDAGAPSVLSCVQRVVHHQPASCMQCCVSHIPCATPHYNTQRCSLPAGCRGYSHPHPPPGLPRSCWRGGSLHPMPRGPAALRCIGAAALASLWTVRHMVAMQCSAHVQTFDHDMQTFDRDVQTFDHDVMLCQHAASCTTHTQAQPVKHCHVCHAPPRLPHHAAHTPYTMHAPHPNMHRRTMDAWFPRKHCPQGAACKAARAFCPSRCFPGAFRPLPPPSRRT